MIIKRFVLALVALAATSNVLALPLHSRRSDEGSSADDNNNNNGQAPTTSPSIPKVAAPSQPAPASLGDTPMSPNIPTTSLSSPPQVANTNKDLSQQGNAPSQTPATVTTTSSTTTADPPADNNAAATKPAPDAQASLPAKDAPTVNNVQTNAPAADTHEVNHAQIIKSSVDAPKESNAQKVPAPHAEAASGSNSNDPAPQSNTGPFTANNVQPQSPETNTSEGKNPNAKITTSSPPPPSAAALVTQPNSSPQDVSHAMVASAPPPAAAAATTEPQTASNPEIAAVPKPEVAAAPKPEIAAVPKPEVAAAPSPPSLQPAPEVKTTPEPKVASAPSSTVDSKTDEQEVKAVPVPTSAAIVEEKPEPKLAAPAVVAKPEPQPAPAQEPKHEAASTPQSTSDPPSIETTTDAQGVKPAVPVVQEEPTKPQSPPAAAAIKPESQPAPVVQGEPKQEPTPAAQEEPKAQPVPDVKAPSTQKVVSSPSSAEGTTGAQEIKPVAIAQDEADPRTAPAVQPVPVKEKSKPQPEPAAKAKPNSPLVPAALPKTEPEALTIPTTAIQCLTLLLETQQPLIENCKKMIQEDLNLIQATELSPVGLDFMYSEDNPVFSTDNFRLKFSGVPDTLSIIEAQYNVAIVYKDINIATFSQSWTPSAMQESTLSTTIDHADIKVLSDNAFSEFIATLITTPEANIVLKGVVDVNISVASTTGGPPKTFIVAGLQFSSPIRLDGLNYLSQTSFERDKEYLVYGESFYLTSVITFNNPSSLSMTFGSVKFNAVDSSNKPLANSAIDVFEIESGENSVELRLMSKVNDSMSLLNKLHYSGDRITFQGTIDSSTNGYLADAFSRLRFTVDYPAILTIPPQTPSVIPGGK